jgi:hypothetical protein
MLKSTVAAAMAASALATSAAWGAAPGDQSSYSLQLTGYVAVSCRAQLSATQAPTAAAGQIPLGQMDEFCNNANGYEVWVDYSPSLAGDTLEVDGKSYALDASGSTRIDASATPAIASKSVALDIPTGGVSGAVSIRVVTL